jgi:hypothetical protein
MTNEEYYQEIEELIISLQSLRREAVSLSRGMIGESLMQEDFFFCAAADRCIRLIDGFIPMLRDRNLTCAGVLLRMQMDNCMRTYAAFIAEDRNAVVNCIIDGNPINKLKDVNGKKMMDGYLKDELTKMDPLFSRVYDNASGYVHLSEKAFYQTVANCENSTIGLGIGTPLPEKRNETLVEGAAAYIHFVKLQFKMLQAVVESKQRYDASHADESAESETNEEV